MAPRGPGPYLAKNERFMEQTICLVWVGVPNTDLVERGAKVISEWKLISRSLKHVSKQLEKCIFQIEMVYI